MTLANERWLAIPDYEGIYEISDHFRVRRLARVTKHGRGKSTRTLNGRMLSVFRTNGYLSVHIWLHPDGRRKAKMLYVEALVANLFPDVQIQAPTSAESDPAEEWRSVAGYEGLYEVSNKGRVRSLARYVGRSKRRYARQRILIGSEAAGYPKVELAKAREIKTVSIHRLVAAAFVPNPLDLPFVHHKDENKGNNRDENLEWVTRAANVQDWFDRRRIVISVNTIETIIAAHKTGKTPAEILAALPRQRKLRRINGEGGHAIAP